MIQRFIEYIAVEKKYSIQTQISYHKDLSDFYVFCKENYQVLELHLVEKKIVRSFIAYLSKQQISKRSINRKISTLNSFYNYLLRIEQIQTSPMNGIKTFKINPPKQIPMSEQEMESILSLNSQDFLATMIVEILYQTGMRCSEICKLSISDVDFSNHQIKIVGKGNKQRIVPIGRELEKTLLQYLQNVKNDEGKYFFVTEKGKKMTERFVYSKVKSYLSAVTSKEKRGPHILRHTFATHLLNSGAEISQVKTLLGHASLASTQVYTHANIEKLKKVLKNAHPRSKEE